MVRSWLAAMHERRSVRRIGCCIHSRLDLCPDFRPDARAVHLLRDPRDVGRSCVGRGWAGTPWHGVRDRILTEGR